MNAPLSRFLVEFSDAPVVEPFDFAAAMEPLPDVEMEPTVSLTVAAFEQQMQEVREQAAAEARANAESDLRAQFEQERADLTRSFDMARETWANEQGPQISASLTAAVAQLESELSTALARALQPLFEDACRSRMLAELATALTSILADPSHPPIRISGPVDLLTAFGNAHPGDTAIDYVVADQPELTIVTDTSRIATRLSACLSTFRIREG